MGAAGCRARREEALAVVAIRAVVFDIGGVLEITPDLGVDRRWETRLGLPAGEWANACTTSGWAAASARSP